MANSATPGIYGGLNRAHPDAKGLVIALPLSEGKGTDFRDRTGVFKDLWSSTGGMVGTDWGNAQRGVGLKSIANSHGLLQNVSRVVSSGDLSFACSVMIFTYGALGSILLRTSNIVFLITAAGHPQISNDAGTITGAVAGGPVLNVNTFHTLGFRLQAGTTASDCFIDGFKQAMPAASANWTLSATTSSIANWPIGGANWNPSYIISDIRVWNRFMPDSTFERMYREGRSKLYLPTFRPFLRTVVAGAGFRANFFPFLHPSLTS